MARETKMNKEQQPEGAQFVRFFGPLLDALRSLGGSGSPSEVTDTIAVACNISEAEQNVLLPSGTSRFANQVAWARFYLSREGYLDSSKRGIWSLTEKGTKTHLSAADSRKIFLDAVKFYAEARRKAKNIEEIQKVQIQEIEPKDHREAVLDLIRSLPASGFERLAQRLLREAGFKQVNVTGRSGDGGIDGNGVLQINPLVSFQVLFQCKKYGESVSPSHVRDFCGAMMGRAD